MSKRIKFPFRDGEKEITIGSEVAYTNGNIQRNKTIMTDKVSKIGSKLIHLEGGRSFYVENGYEKADICGSEIFSSEEMVLYIRKTEEMKKKLYDAFGWNWRSKEANVTPDKIEQCYRIIFGDDDGLNQ